MSKHLVVFGHGQGDPGAIGNGYQEATFTRNILGPKLKAWSAKLKKNQIDFYNESLDMFQQTKASGGAYGVNGYASVTEFHLDALNANATGGHVIINSKYSPDANDLAIGEVLEKYVGLWGSSKPTGTYKRDDLLNMNVFANRGISYRLVELGFISNVNDVKKLVNNIDAVAKELIEAITGESLGGSSSNDTNDNNSSNPKTHDEIIAESPAKTINGMTAKLEKFTEYPIGSFREAGWAHAGKENFNYCFIFLIDATTGHEIGRQKSKDIARPDVNAAYGLSSGNKPGFDGTIDIKKHAGKKAYVKIRLTNDIKGNTVGGAKDVDFKEYVLTIPKR
ncbi:N-acetylmuramoyl-L-alanine amidase [Enterococcus thailandicus]|uniref:N-acetylmuramoyl-L-alanine amidase n=1 Tax=Enterococcus thailandicus TaxID=417368 RepID=UPI0034DD27BF